MCKLKERTAYKPGCCFFTHKEPQGSLRMLSFHKRLALFVFEGREGCCFNGYQFQSSKGKMSSIRGKVNIMGRSQPPDVPHLAEARLCLVCGNTSPIPGRSFLPKKKASSQGKRLIKLFMRKSSCLLTAVASMQGLS